MRTWYRYVVIGLFVLYGKPAFGMHLSATDSLYVFPFDQSYIAHNFSSLVHYGETDNVLSAGNYNPGNLLSLSQIVVLQKKKIRNLWIILTIAGIYILFFLVNQCRFYVRGLHRTGTPPDKSKVTGMVDTSILIIKVYADLTYMYSHDRELLQRKLYNEMTSKIIETLNLDKLREVVDVQYGDCAGRLLSAHPQLTEGDITICYMIVAGLSNRQMTAMLELKDVNSLYVKKARLKERLQLPRDVKTEDYLIRYLHS